MAKKYPNKLPLTLLMKQMIPTNANDSDIICFFSYYETRKKSILVNIELYNVDEQIKNHFY